MSAAASDAALLDEIRARLQESYFDIEAADAFVLSPDGAALPEFVELLSPSDPELRARAGDAAAALGVTILDIRGELLLVPYLDGAARANGMTGPVRLLQVNGLDITGISGAIGAFAGLDPTDGRAPEVTVVGLYPDAEGVMPSPRVYRLPFAEEGQRRSVEALMLSGGRLYLRIYGFSRGETAAAVRDALGHVPAHVILDLRHSSGGSVVEMAELAGLFLGENRVIADLDRDVAGFGSELVTPPGPDPWRGPLTVLTGQWTYSAGEILTLGLRQWRRAAVVGGRTNGKCVVQRRIALGGEGHRLLLAVAEASFDNLRCLGDGVQPTIAVPEDKIGDDRWLLSQATGLAKLGRYLCLEEARINTNDGIEREVFTDNWIREIRSGQFDPQMGTNLLAIRSPGSGAKQEDSYCFGPFAESAALRVFARTQLLQPQNLALTERLFVPHYWSPPVMGSSIEPYWRN